MDGIKTAQGMVNVKLIRSNHNPPPTYTMVITSTSPLNATTKFASLNPLVYQKFDNV